MEPRDQVSKSGVQSIGSLSFLNDLFMYLDNTVWHGYRKACVKCDLRKIALKECIVI